MTRCTSTAALFGGDMQLIPGITLQCELEAGHDTEPAVWDDTYTPEHRHTLTWGNPSVDELAEVLDPNESFDLEVDIAPAETIREQRDATEATGVPDANPRCLVCGREVEADVHSTFGYRHVGRWQSGQHRHGARVA
jgi:hypothetical protein